MKIKINLVEPSAHQWWADNLMFVGALCFGSTLDSLLDAALVGAVIVLGSELVMCAVRWARR